MGVCWWVWVGVWNVMEESDEEVLGDLPVILQSRHCPNHALGAGGPVGVVSCDFARGFPAVVDVGGAVDEEEFFDYLRLTVSFFVGLFLADMLRLITKSWFAVHLTL